LLSGTRHFARLRYEGQHAHGYADTTHRDYGVPRAPS
jgi:hypothetical protein